MIMYYLLLLCILNKKQGSAGSARRSAQIGFPVGQSRGAFLAFAQVRYALNLYGMFSFDSIWKRNVLQQLQNGARIVEETF